MLNSLFNQSDLLVSLLILVVALLLRYRAKSWANPSVVFALFWFLMTFLPIVAVPQLHAAPIAVTFILASVVAFGAPVFFFKWQPALEIAHGRQRQHSRVYSSPWMILFIICTLVLVVFLHILHLNVNGYPPSVVFHNPLRVGCEFLAVRYLGNVVPTAYIKVATILNYFVVPVAAFAILERRSTILKVILIFVALLPSAINVIFYGDKGTVFLATAFFFGGWVVARLRYGNDRFITWKNLLFAPFLAIFIFSFVSVALMNRSAVSCADTVDVRILRTIKDKINKEKIQSRSNEEKIQSRSNEEKMLTRSEASTFYAKRNEEQSSASEGGIAYSLRSYAFGHLYAFSDWFSHLISDETFSANIEVLPKGEVTLPETLTPDLQSYSNPPHLAYGFWTFMAAGKYANPSLYNELPPGYFAEYFRDRAVLQTNIYTFFRGLIYDFGIAGALLFMLAGGLVMNLVFRSMLHHRSAPISQALYIGFAGFLYTSYIISLFVWGSVYASIVAIMLFLAAIGWLENRR